MVDLLLTGTIDVGINRASRQKKDLAALIVTEGFTRSLESERPSDGEEVIKIG